MSEYKTYEENFRDWLEYARGLSVEEIRFELRDKLAFHKWAVEAYEQALTEKDTQSDPTQENIPYAGEER